MNAGSLFTGIGGLDLGIGIPPAWFCEADKHCRQILERHWPGVPIYPDVRELGADAPRVDVLHGGYPCQPFSVAGKRRGVDDSRHLWPEFARLIRVLRPRVVVAENVAGHLGLGFQGVLADLAALGMDVGWGVIRASDVGAPHRRARLFIVAADPVFAGTRRDSRQVFGTQEPGGRRQPESGERQPQSDAHSEASADAVSCRLLGLAEASPRRLAATQGRSHSAADADGDGCSFERRQLPVECDAHGRGSEEIAWGKYEPAIRRWERVLGRSAPRPTDDRGRLMPEFAGWMMGFPAGWTDGVAHTNRLRMYGNAVVPQQAALAIRLLAAVDLKAAA